MPQPPTLSRRFRKGNRGTAMVEFALIAPVLGLFLAGIVAYGGVSYVYITAATSAREAARLVALGGMTTAQRSCGFRSIRSLVPMTSGQ